MFNKITGAAMMLSLLSGCGTNSEPPQQATAAHAAPQEVMSDNAKTLCNQAGGALSIARQLNGQLAEICQLTDGRRCDESALLSGGCVR